MNAEALWLLIILGGVNHQIAHTITVGVIFEDCRAWVRANCGSKLGYLVQCHLCCGTWIGFLEGAVTYDQIRMTASALVDAVLVAFFVALVGRLVNEAQAIMAAKVVELKHRSDRAPSAEYR